MRARKNRRLGRNLGITYRHLIRQSEKHGFLFTLDTFHGETMCRIVGSHRCPFYGSDKNPVKAIMKALARYHQV